MAGENDGRLHHLLIMPTSQPCPGYVLINILDWRTISRDERRHHGSRISAKKRQKKLTIQHSLTFYKNNDLASFVCVGLTVCGRSLHCLCLHAKGSFHSTVLLCSPTQKQRGANPPYANTQSHVHKGKHPPKCSIHIIHMHSVSGNKDWRAVQTVYYRKHNSLFRGLLEK